MVLVVATNVVAITLSIFPAEGKTPAADSPDPRAGPSVPPSRRHRR